MMDFACRLLDFILAMAICVAVVLCPVFLALIHDDLVQIREITKPCECRPGDHAPGPVLPRVLPRLRRIGEGAE